MLCWHGFASPFPSRVHAFTIDLHNVSPRSVINLPHSGQHGIVTKPGFHAVIESSNIIPQPPPPTKDINVHDRSIFHKFRFSLIPNSHDPLLYLFNTDLILGPTVAIADAVGEVPPTVSGPSLPDVDYIFLTLPQKDWAETWEAFFLLRKHHDVAVLSDGVESDDTDYEDSDDDRISADLVEVERLAARRKRRSRPSKSKTAATAKAEPRLPSSHKKRACRLENKIVFINKNFGDSLFAFLLKRIIKPAAILFFSHWDIQGLLKIWMDTDSCQMPASFTRSPTSSNATPSSTLSSLITLSSLSSSSSISKICSWLGDTIWSSDQELQVEMLLDDEVSELQSSPLSKFATGSPTGPDPPLGAFSCKTSWQEASSSFDLHNGGLSIHARRYRSIWTLRFIPNFTMQQALELLWVQWILNYPWSTLQQDSWLLSWKLQSILFIRKASISHDDGRFPHCT